MQYSHSSKYLSDIVAVPKQHIGMTKEARGIFIGMAKGILGIGAGLARTGFRAAKNPYLLVPGVTIGGGIAAYKGYQKHKNSSKPNYTTFLRNQALAGNIGAEEMSPEDLRSVRQLDMG